MIFLKNSSAADDKRDWGMFRTLFLNHLKIPNLQPISKSKKNILFLHPLGLIFDLQTRFFHAYSYTFFENKIFNFQNLMG
jgi:hypothetical protein